MLGLSGDGGGSVLWSGLLGCRRNVLAGELGAGDGRVPSPRLLLLPPVACVIHPLPLETGVAPRGNRGRGLGAGGGGGRNGGNILVR